MNKKLFLIYSIIFIGLLGFGIIIPTLPFIAKRFGANPTEVGLLLASYSIFQFIFSPILGRLSDRFGRKPVLAASLVGSAIGFFIIAGANSLWVIFLSRIIDGATGGNISVAQAYIADITKGRERTKALGMISAAFGLGFVFGPLIGGLLSVYGFAVPYIFAGILSLIDAVLIMALLPETEKKSVQKKTYGHFLDKKTLQNILKPKIVMYLTILFFLVTLSFSLMQGMFALYSEEVFGWGERENGYFFSYIGIVLIFTQAVVIRRAVEYASNKKLIIYSLPFMALSFIIFGTSGSVFVYLVAGTILPLFFGTFNTAVQSEISNQSDPEEQGVVLGTVQGLSALARAIGPAIGGFLFANISISAPFLFSAVMILAIFVGATRVVEFNS